MKALAFALAAALAVAPSLGHADAKSLYAEGQEAYKKQNFTLAAAKFAAAYDADPDPVYLFNAAQAFRLANDCVRAADYYARFLAKVPNPPNGDKIRGWSDEMTKCARDRDLAKPATIPTTPTTPTTTPATTHDPAAPVDGVSVRPDQTPSDPDAHAHSSYRTPGLVLLGARAAALVAGGVFAYGWHKAQADSDAVCGQPCMMWDAGFNARLADDKSKARRDSALAISGFALGGALVATGAILAFALGDSGESHVAVAPANGGATVSTTFRF